MIIWSGWCLRRHQNAGGLSRLKMLWWCVWRDWADWLVGLPNGKVKNVTGIGMLVIYAMSKGCSRVVDSPSPTRRLEQEQDGEGGLWST